MSPTSDTFRSLFNTSSPIIGMIHLPPLPGYANHPGMDTIFSHALEDAVLLEKAGMDAVIIENNYDVPHTELVTPEVADALLQITKKVEAIVSIPVGLSVLWNDYKTALDISTKTRVRFVRVPVFVDSVETQYGTIYAHPEAVIQYREHVGATEVMLFTDIQVKHAKMLNDRPIAESAIEAQFLKSDGIIVTGSWTGDAPRVDDLQNTRKAVGEEFPILVGSGATVNNLAFLLAYANGIIVGTALKSGKPSDPSQETNLFPWQVRLDKTAVQTMVTAFKNIVS